MVYEVHHLSVIYKQKGFRKNEVLFVFETFKLVGEGLTPPVLKNGFNQQYWNKNYFRS